MQVPNCYFDDTVCADDEWCMLDDHSKWGKPSLQTPPKVLSHRAGRCYDFGILNCAGAYAMGPEGETPSTGAGDQCGAYQDAGLDELFNVTCGGEVRSSKLAILAHWKGGG